MLCQGFTCPYSNTYGHSIGKIKVILIISFAQLLPAISAKLMSGFVCKMHFLSAFFTSALYFEVSSVCMFSPTWNEPWDSFSRLVEVRTFCLRNWVAIFSLLVIDWPSLPSLLVLHENVVPHFWQLPLSVRTRFQLLLLLSPSPLPPEPVLFYSPVPPLKIVRKCYLLTFKQMKASF